MEYTSRDLLTLNLGNNFKRKTLTQGQTVLYLRKQIQPMDNSNVPRPDYITARDQSMVESGVTEGGKNTASFLFRKWTQQLEHKHDASS